MLADPVARIRSFLLFTLCMLVVLGVGILEDHRSCARQVPVRAQSNTREEVLNDFLQTAANARWHSYLLERRTNEAQASIDLRLAIHYRAQAATLHKVPRPNCQSLVPDA